MSYRLDVFKMSGSADRLVCRQVDWTTLRRTEYKNGECVNEGLSVVEICKPLPRCCIRTTALWFYVSFLLSKLSFNALIMFLLVTMFVYVCVYIYVHPALIHKNLVILFLQITVLKVVRKALWCSWMRTSLRNLRVQILTSFLPLWSSDVWSWISHR